MGEYRNDLGRMTQEAVGLLQQDKLVQAKDLLTSVCLEPSADADAWFWLGRVNGRLRDLDAARECFKRAIEAQPNHVKAYVNLGKVFAIQGQHDKALMQCQAALRLDPNEHEAHSNMGYICFAQGRHDEAEHSYEAVIRLNPTCAEAYYNLGNLKRLQGKYDEAVSHYQQSIRIDPSNPAAYNNLGLALTKQGQLEPGMDAYMHALALDPGYAEVYANLALASLEQGRHVEAERMFGKALELKPALADARMKLCAMLAAQERHDEALAQLNAAVNINPRHHGAYAAMGDILHDLGRYAESAACYGTLVALNPQSADAHYKLGNANRLQKRFAEAETCYRQVIHLTPDSAAAYNDLGGVLYKLGRFDDAIKNYRHALVLDPNYAQAYNNLAVSLREQGHMDEAERMFKEALRLDPGLIEICGNLGAMYNRRGDAKSAREMLQRFSQGEQGHADAHGALLMTMQYVPEYSTDFLHQAARQWAATHASAGARAGAHSNSADPHRRLRIGYVSADFNHHPVGYFIEPVLNHHNDSCCDVYCYYNGGQHDDQTRRLQRLAGHWRDIAGQTDAAAARQVAQDKIDILVDLSGHTADNRLLMFARKPAPIQATWMGYFATTGMDAMDYIIGDRYVIPPDHEDQFVERVIRLPAGYLCYSPPRYLMDVSPPPASASASARVTFGCFNNPAKLSKGVIASWAEILHKVPDSQLYLKYRMLDNEGVRERYRRAFAQYGVASDRIRFSGYTPRDRHMSAYGEVDIALDPYPYNGGTVTCDALWMGVPVISLAGDRFVSRVGASILTTVGMSEFVADTEDDYIAKAVALASDLPRLVALRQGLRTRLLSSPLCDGAVFAVALEGVYRSMWQAWCKRERAWRIFAKK